MSALGAGGAAQWWPHRWRSTLAGRCRFAAHVRIPTRVRFETVFATSPPAFASSPAAAASVRAQIREVLPKAPQTPVDDTYVPAHALRQADLRVVVSDADGYAEQSYGDEAIGDESYGDFDSYASLALATAR